jgi:hypothetical protein
MSLNQTQKVIDKSNLNDSDSEEDDWETIVEREVVLPVTETPLPITKESLPLEEAEEAEEESEAVGPAEDTDERYMFESFKTADTAKLGAKIIDLRPGHKSEGKSRIAMAGDTRARTYEQKKKKDKIDIRSNIDKYINFITAFNKSEYNSFKNKHLSINFLNKLDVIGSLEPKRNKFIPIVKFKETYDPGDSQGHQKRVQYKKDSPEITFLANLFENLHNCSRLDIQITKKGKKICLLAELLKYLTWVYLSDQTEYVDLALAQYLMRDTKERCPTDPIFKSTHYAFEYIKSKYPDLNPVKTPFTISC